MMATEEEKGKKAGLGSERTGFTAHCPHCRQESVFEHARIANRRHLLLTVLTGGIWIFVWLALLFGKCMRPWRCRVCGWHKPEFRKACRNPEP
jgi:rubredoxin